jgi:hypothetical protein
MADGRMLKKTISNSKKLAMVSDRAKVIWFMMLPHTDIAGRLNACPEIAKGQYLTMLNYPAKTIQKCLEELHNAGLIILYKINGDQYAEFTRFADFQSLRADREGESKIPGPDCGTTPGVVQENSGLSKEKLSKEKLRQDNDVSSVFGHWNKQSLKGRWKSHTRLTPDIRAAITDTLKQWPAAEIKQAITNFAMVLHGKEYLWTYDKWGLREFLTRHLRDDRKTLQWWRFHPNNFREGDWLTEAVQKKRHDLRRQYTDSILKASPEKIKENYAMNTLELNWLIRELRPEVINPSE